MTIETESAVKVKALELTEWERTQLLQFSETGADFRPYSEAERKRWKDLADKLRGSTLKDDPGNGLRTRCEELVKALGQIMSPGTVAGMHEQDRAPKLQAIAAAAIRALIPGGAG